MAKFTSKDISTQSTLYYVLSSIIRAISPFMPYVSEEIYGMLPFKKCKSVMIDTYPEFDKDLCFDTKNVDDMLEFIRLFRTFKLENKVGRDFSIVYKNFKDYTLIENMLKLNGKNNGQIIYNASYDVVYKDYGITVYFHKDASQDADAAKKRIKELEASIARRKSLLANENYTSKAPLNIVQNDRLKLEEEEEELRKLKLA